MTAAFGEARLRFVTEGATCWATSFAKPAHRATAKNAGLESKSSAVRQPLSCTTGKILSGIFYTSKKKNAHSNYCVPIDSCIPISLILKCFFFFLLNYYSLARQINSRINQSQIVVSIFSIRNNLHKTKRFGELNKRKIFLK